MFIHLSWSGGKDSALCYAYLRELYPRAHISLHCAVSQSFERVSMHGVPLSLIEQQARAIGIPLEVVRLPESSDNHVYEQVILLFYRQIHSEGFEYVAFGDLHLEDLRQYRLHLCHQAGIKPMFPLWQVPYDSLCHWFEQWGIQALVCAANLEQLPAESVGKNYHPKAFAHRFPGVDTFGERGEFHTFVYDAAFFKKKLLLHCQEVVFRQYHYSLADRSQRTHTYAFADLSLKALLNKGS